MERASAPRRLRDGRQRALCALLMVLSDARQGVLAAGGESTSYGGKKARMEIRVQDYSYSNGARERPVVEVVTEDIRTSDMLSLAQKLSGGGQLFGHMSHSDGDSWWQQPVIDDLTVGDAVLLLSFAFAAFLALRLAALAIKLGDLDVVTLNDVVQTLVEIQIKDPSLPSMQLDEMPTQASLDAAMNEKSVRDAWERLQELYISFRSLQASISRQHAYKRDARLRRRHQGSFDDRNDELRRVLSELTKELPQGFTPEMFASLGSAMRRAMATPTPPAVESNEDVTRRQRAAPAATAAV